MFRNLTRQNDSWIKIKARYLLPDHVHMMISIPPKYAVSRADFIKGKSAIHSACG
jgi:putative transposase